MKSSNIKKSLYDFCSDYANKRIKTVNDALRDAQAGANAESKSTAGDKHDTSRSMMQIEVEQLSKQLSEAKQLKADLEKISPSAKQAGGPGALVMTTNGNYFIAIAAGKTEIGGVSYFTVSAISPIATTLKGVTKDKLVKFNDVAIKVLDVL